MWNKKRDEFLIEKLFDYQLTLVARRWQFFAVYVLINGLLYNAIGRATDIGNLTIENLITFVSIMGILTAIVLLQLVSIIAKQLHKVQIRLLEEHKFTVLNIVNERFGFYSVTTLIYLSIIIMEISWFYLLFCENKLVFCLLLLSFIINLFFLKWSPPKSNHYEQN